MSHALADLVDAFPQARVTKATVDVYHRHLADIPADALAAAASDLIRTERFFPSVSAIREAAAERLLALPTEGEALAQVGRRAGWHRGDGEPPYVHALVGETLALVGGIYALRTAENPSAVRGQFGRLYRERRGQVVRDVQTGSFRALEPGRPLAAVSCP